MTKALTISNVAWVPYSRAQHKIAESEFEKRLYKDSQCSKCEYLPERHCDVCESCPAFLGHYRLWRKGRAKSGEKLIGLPLGNRGALGDATSELRFKDKRITRPMANPIVFTGEFQKGQRQSVNRMAKKGYGILEAPPRSGKTVMGIAIACKLGYRTLILANQYEYLKQFLETIIGSKENGAKPLTNANKFGGLGKVVGFCKKYEDFEKYDICLATYQSFISVKGKDLLKSVAHLFGTVIVDEADKVAADCFLKVVNEFPAKCRIGLTGTPERKDKKEILTQFILGPVNHVMEVEMLVPRVVVMETHTKLPRKYKMWTAFENALVENVERNKLIIKTAVADIKAGRHIVIPVVRVHHAIALAKAINRVMGETVAAHFIGPQSKHERDAIRTKARNGSIKCVIGIRSIVARGINVPLWDTLYEIMPISNTPNLKQESSRIRTPMEDKPVPLIRHFIEDDGMARGCLRTCYWGTYRPEGFHIGKRDMDLLHAYMGKGDIQYKARAKITF